MWAATHAPKELSGRSTALALLATRIAPGLLDHFLARTGYRAQQLDEPVDPDRPDNRFVPVDGAHGRTARMNGKAMTTTTTRSRATWIVALLVLALLAAVVLVLASSGGGGSGGGY